MSPQTRDNLENLIVDRQDAVAIVTINRPRVLNALNSHTLDELAARHAGPPTRCGSPRRHPDGRRRESVRRRVPTSTSSPNRRRRRAGPRASRAARVRSRRAASASRSSPRSTATRSAAAASWPWPARSGSRRRPRSSGSRKSISGSSPGTAARSGCHGWSARGRALELLLTGDQISAAEAHRIGLVNRVVPAADLMREAVALGALLATKAPLAARYIIDAVQTGTRHAAALRRRCSKRRSSVSCRAPTTCGKGPARFSRSASRSSREIKPCDIPTQRPAPLPSAAGLRFAIVVSRFNIAITDKLRDGAQRCPRRSRSRRGRRGSGVRARRVRDSAGCAGHCRNRAVRRGRLPGLRHPRRDAALRVHLVSSSRTASSRRRATRACRWRSAC